MSLLLLSLLMSAQARPPRIASFELKPTTCGEWQLDVEASGRGRAVLTTSEMVVARWRPSQKPTYSRTGTAEAGEDVTFSLRVGRERETRTLTMPPYPLELVPSVTLFAAERSHHRLEAAVVDPCNAYPRARIDARIGDDVVFANVMYGGVSVELPGQQPGIHPVELRFFTRDDELLHTTIIEIDVRSASLDGDQDGFLPPIAGGSDCDDHNNAVHPDADEGLLANGIDDDCDGIIDNGTTAYDDDGDGVSDDDGDCDDYNSKVYPGAAELWDCQDQDCDGEIDEGINTSNPPRDVHEPNNTNETATDLKTDELRAFTRDLTLWVDGPDDIETFRFYSHDGLFDNWGIWATATSRGDGARYEFRVSKGDREAVTTIDHTSETLSMSGLAGLEDSGTYLLTIRALDERSCPLTVRLRSR